MLSTRASYAWWILPLFGACSAASKTDATAAGAGGGATATNATATSSASQGAGGAGGGGPVCTPNATTCDGQAATKTCLPDGSDYAASVPCMPGTLCVEAMPGQAACQCSPPGATACQGADVVTCGMDGKLKVTLKCPNGTTCRDGLCDDIRCPDEIGAAGTTALPNSGWPRYRHDNRSSGFTHAVVADMPKLAWSVFVGGTHFLNGAQGGLAAGPVVNQSDVVFISGGDGDGKGGHFYAWSAGKLVYEFAGVTGYGYTTPAVRNDGTAYYSTAAGVAYAVDPKGMQQWQYSFGFQNDCSPIVTKDGYVIYGSDAQQLFALKPDGSLLWKSDPAGGPGEVDSALAESCEGVILAGGSHGWTALDAKDGSTHWQVKAGGPIGALMSSPNLAADGTMYGIDSSGTGWAIDKNGKVLWSKPLGPAGPATDFARVGDKLFAVLNDGSLHAFAAADGTALWSQPVGNKPETYRHGGPVVDGKLRLYVNSNDGYLYAFETGGKQLFKLAASGVASTSANSFGTMAIGKDGTIYLPGNDGSLYAFH